MIRGERTLVCAIVRRGKIDNVELEWQGRIDVVADGISQVLCPQGFYIIPQLGQIQAIAIKGAP